jgi:filamentous hemagglutinin family protein
MKYIFVRPQNLISIVTNISHNSSLELLVRSIVITLSIFSGFTIPASADITSGGDGTIVNQSGNTFNITGGTPNPPNGNNNLFHSFGTFNLTTTQTIPQVANFQPAANVQNILGRINGGSPSSIDGKIQVTGGDPKGVNLYLMNPAGIVFGKGASLDINGAFTATTAKAIDFGNGNWFNAVGANTYGNLNVNPIGLAFPGVTQGSIFSAATLSNVQPGKSITLVGGTVISTGDIKTAGGNISIATVNGGKYVKIKVDGSILGLELPTALTTPNSINQESTSFTPLNLAALLTGDTTKNLATGVTVDSNNVVKLVGDTRSILPGDIVTKNLNTSGIENSITPDGGNLSLNTQKGNIITSTINTSGGLSSSEGSSKGGNLSLNTQNGDIFLDSIDTSTNNFGGKGGTGGNVTVNAGGLFRVIGNNQRSIFTGGNDDLGAPGEALQGGKINITHQGTSFVVGGKTDITSGQGGGNTITLIDPFSFPKDASGTRGAILTRNTNGTLQVVFNNGVFKASDGVSTTGFSITAVAPSTGGTGSDQTSNPDQQASRPKSKENCTPSSTSVASNPTAAPTRSAGNPNTVSADPCQPSNSNNEILQILTDRN